MSTLIHDEPAVHGGRRAARGGTLARLVQLHLRSRRFPAACAALALCAPLLQWAVRSALGQSTIAGATTSAKQFSLLLEVVAAAVVSAALHGPFGESERIAGHRLPWLRLITAVLLVGVALAATCIGVLGTGLPTGDPAVLRDTAGLIGIGVLGTVLIGGHFAWVGPAAYWVLGAYAVADHWQTPWVWPARPGPDLGAALCAYALLAASLVAITVVGPREHRSD